jgi:hypothetical protein
LKDAAKALGINYSTAKTILRIFRIEKRIEKKNADEERQLKEIITKFKSDKTKTNDFIRLIQEKVGIQETQANAQPDSSASSQPTEEKTNPQSPLSSPCNEFSKRMDFFTSKIKEFHQTLNGCYEQIINNQMIINNLFDCLSHSKVYPKPSEQNCMKELNLLRVRQALMSNVGTLNNRPFSGFY